MVTPICVWEHSLVRVLQDVLETSEKKWKEAISVFTSYLLPGLLAETPSSLLYSHLSKVGNTILWVYTGIWWKQDHELKGWVNVSLLFKYHYYLTFIGIRSLALGGLLLTGQFSCIMYWPFYGSTEAFLFFLSFFSLSCQSRVGEKQHGLMENVKQKQWRRESVHNGYTHCWSASQVLCRVPVRFLWQKQSGTCASPCVNTNLEGPLWFTKAAAFELVW